MKERRANRGAKAWTEQAPSTPYKCEGKQLGQMVPGKGGGVITACATPTTAKPKEGQYWVGLPEAGMGQAISKRKVSQRLARARRPKHRTPTAEVEQAVYYNERTHRIPTPTGDEREHDPRTSPCSPQNERIWGEEYRQAVRSAVEEGMERAAIQEEGTHPSEPIDDVPFNNPSPTEDQAIAEAFARHPRAPEWEDQAMACTKAYERRKAARRAKPSKAEARAIKQAQVRAKKEMEKKERARQRLLKAASKRKRKNPIVATVQLNKSEIKNWREGKHEKILNKVGEISLRAGGVVRVVDDNNRMLLRVLAIRGIER